MAILGREVYQNILLSGDGGDSSCLFANAIRFSTHGEYYCKEIRVDVEDHNFPHFHKYKKRDESEVFYKKIYFHGSQYSVDQVKQEDLFDVRLCDIVIESVFEVGLTVIDFIVNPDGQFEYVCSIDEDNNPVFRYLKLDEVFEIGVIDSLNLNSGSVLTVYIPNSDRNGAFFLINSISDHWDKYRALGINIPLLIIQVLLGRHVKSLQMVDLDDIFFGSESIQYSLADRGVFWFDLDETLVCRWQPIRKIIHLLNMLKQHDKDVRLITRHTFVIEDTLSSIGLKVEDFNEIVHVSLLEKKSDFIRSDHVFIDNEFPERKDVRQRSKAMVMDLDQIDFLSVGVL